MRRNTFLLLQWWGNSAGEATMENSFLSASSKQLYSDSSFGKYVFQLLYLPFKTIITALLTFSFFSICKTLAFARVLYSYFSLKWKFPALFFFVFLRLAFVYAHTLLLFSFNLYTHKAHEMFFFCFLIFILYFLPLFSSILF